MYIPGLYNEKCIAWKDLTQARKTWPQLKIFFTKVVRDCKRLQKAVGTNYRTNCAVTETLQQDTIDTLAKLPSAMADDQNT
eukprot:1705951-Ditylum_brightwellii.AAC.1